MKTTYRRKAGRQADPDRVIMRPTTVSADPEQMKLLEEAGYTHVEAYRLGIKILLEEANKG